MVTRGVRVGDTEALEAARAAGISMFVSTGDQGAYDCQDQQPADSRLTVDWPASNADAIAVGGTRLDLAANSSYLGESGWSDPLSAGGGGGGLSAVTSRPLWQSAPGITAALLHGRRGLPDVSADADPGTGWMIYWNGGFISGVGGTSAAAPFWAASMLLVSEYAARHGVGRLGYVNPMLYALASKRQRFRPFHDVTFGSNRYYRAAPGWDPATGLGSPDVYNLARDVVVYLRSHHRR
jgi:kumamolisin